MTLTLQLFKNSNDTREKLRFHSLSVSLRFRIRALMETFGLIQHVHVPTHSSGHTLDLIITRSIDDVTITSPFATFALSDHFFVECLLDTPHQNILVQEVCYRKIKHIDLNADICASDLFQKTWSSVNDMSKCYDVTLYSILDKHAPWKSKVMTVRPMVPWFNDSLIKEAES